MEKLVREGEVNEVHILPFFALVSLSMGCNSLAST
jgi:hypothetical protein